MVLSETVNSHKSSLFAGMEKAAAKTVVWNAERKCFAWEFSARATNTLQTFAYETEVFLVCGENMAAAKAILRMTLFILFNGFREMLMHFLQYGIRLCAVTKATVLPLNFSAEKKQYSGGRNLANPETLCTIFLHP